MAGQNGKGNGNGNGGHAVMMGASERCEIAFRPLGGRRARVLAYGGWSKKHLTQDARYLYWSDDDDGTITRLPKDGGVPLILATEQRGARALTLAGDHLYWVLYRHQGAGAVVRMPVEGGEVEVLEGGQELPCALAVLGDTIAWTTFGDGLATGTVMLKRLGAPAVTLATKQKQPGSIALDADQVYWTCAGLKHPEYFTDGSVVRHPRDGSRKRYIIAKYQSMAGSVVQDDEWIYWNTARMIYPPYAAGSILRRRKGVKRTQRVVIWGEQSGHLALDGEHVYWFEHFGGTLYRLPRQGGPLEQLMAECEDRMTCVDSYVIDDRCIYWTARNSQGAGGAVFKMAK